MINLGASSDSFMMKAETDFGPRVSFELNSLFPSSLVHVSQNFSFSGGSGIVLENLIRKLRVVILFCQYMKEFGHWFRQVLEIGQTLDN